MSFWKIATVEQKLAQIDGAIDLGMTSGQCAMNCHTAGWIIRNFARVHGRNFPHKGAEAMRKRRVSHRHRTEVASHVGSRIKCETVGFDPSNLITARIFPIDDHSNLFDPSPFDQEAFA